MMRKHIFSRKSYRGCKRRVFKTPDGFSLLEVLIAASSLGVVSLGVIAVNNNMLKNSANSMATHQADAFRKMLIAQINNDSSWSKTVNDPANSTFQCIRATSDCRGATGPFRVLDARGNMVYDQFSPTAGFNMKGVACSGYSANAATGNDACPFRTEFTWTAICPPAGNPCLNPLVSVRGETSFHPSDKNNFRKFAFNAASYGLNFTRNATNTTQGSGQGYYLAKWASNSTLGSSKVFESTTSAFIGIGTASPTAKLHLDSTAIGGPAIRIVDGTQANARLLTSAADGTGSWLPPAVPPYADRAGYADNAGFATNSGHAGSADTANSANEANVCHYIKTGGNYATFVYNGATSQNETFDLHVDGHKVKTFVIPHPTDPERYLVHGTLEGPEGAVYYRGESALKNGYARISLPTYFEALTRQTQRTVLLTLIDGLTPIAVKAGSNGFVHDGYFEVFADDKSSAQRFVWEVKAVRKDVPPLEVEPLKSENEVMGDGPYTYTFKKGALPKKSTAYALRARDQKIRELESAICALDIRSPLCQSAKPVSPELK